jgi:predicted MFS family arabinose efflux permease
VAAAAASSSSASHTRSPFADPKVYLLSFVLFCMLCGSYALSFWLPTVIRDLGVHNLQQVGLYAMIPDAAAAISTLLYSRHSDKHFERRWHFIVAALIAATALSATSLTAHRLGLSISMFAIARAAIVSSLPVFWAMTTDMLSTRSSVAGIAVISSLSNLSGMTSPFLLGLIKSATGSLVNGMFAISALMIVAALCVFFCVPRPQGSREMAAKAETLRA